MYFSRRSVVLSSLLLLSATGFILSSTLPSGKKQTKRSGSAEDQWIAQEMARMTVEEKIAQSFMVACWSNKGSEHLQEVENYVRNQKIGGIIFFQGERDNLTSSISRFQSASRTPLLIGMDGEWGTAMRLFGEDRFPYAQTLGAANNPELTEEIASYMGIECNQLGIHLNFSPVADVNSNPDNPVIGFRAFGSDPVAVSKHVAAFVKGTESTNVLSCIKHFPGHGDTDKDSHLELPTVSHTKSQFESIDFAPFKSGIEAGASSVMVAHLNVPALDDSGTPSSLSEKVIEGYLRKELKFKGLVISDALNMKAVADKYGKSEVVAKAYQAGCDLLLFPESVSEAIALIRKKMDSGDITKADVDAHCKRVLQAKYKAIIGKPMVKRADMTNARTVATAKVYEEAMVVLKNEHSTLPLNKLDKKIVRISVGPHATAFHESIDRYAPIEHHHFYTAAEAVERLESIKLNDAAIILTDFHANTQRDRNNYGFGDWKKVADVLPLSADVVATFFGNPLVLKKTTQLPESFDACILANENHALAQDRAGQFIMGAFDVNGKLDLDLNETFKKGTGISVKGNGRLKYTLPEELGINSAKLQEIDAIVNNAIEQKAMPGCQVVVAIKGKVIYQKAFGHTKYEGGDSVTNEHLYDVASVTKIAASTVALMRLKSEGKFDVTASLGELVPELVRGTEYERVRANDLLTHQAGLVPFIEFFRKTMKNGELDQTVYSKEKKDGYTSQVADGIWIRDDYWKTMVKEIVETPLSGEKKYVYSDLGYYFFRAYIMKTTGMTQDKFVESSIYYPLGLQHMTYLPLKKFKRKMVVPTEDEHSFRNQLIWGYVHDPGAAMVGGVGGHAGLFSNATDMAALMQVLLNKGQVGTYNLFDRSVVDQFTSCQYCPGNRRGLGFDRPTNSKKDGMPCEAVSSQSFGHSGFTGTFAWADPEFGVNYVFLSNRVYPNAGNKKLSSLNVRTEIHRVIYEALNQAK